MAEGYEPRPQQWANVVINASYNVSVSANSKLYASQVGNIVFVGGYFSGNVSAGTDIIKGLPKPVSVHPRYVCQNNAGTQLVVLYFASTETDKIRIANTADGCNFAISYVTSEY